MSTSKLSIIIVNYNSTNNTFKLIESIKIIKPIVGEIIVIDNNSSDIRKKTFGKKNNVYIIKNNKNLGFARAVNQGIKISKNKFILLLNPDTLIIDDSIIKSFETVRKDKSVGIIGGKIKKYNTNSYQLTATTKPNFLTAIFEFTNLKKIFPDNYFTNKFWIEKTNKINKITDVYSLCGAFMIIRKYLDDQINYFDERYFLYLEDLDFGLQTRKKGFRVVFDPRSQIEHIGGSSNTSKYNIVLKYWYESRKKFFYKNLPKIEAIILNLLFNIEISLLSLYHHLTHTPNE